MTYNKALDVLRTYINYLNGNIPMYKAPSRHKLHQVLQALEKFKGAVNVLVHRGEYFLDEDVPNIELKHIGNQKTHKLYAVPKEKSNE